MGKGELSDVPMVLMLLAESRGCSCTVDCWGRRELEVALLVEVVSLLC